MNEELSQLQTMCGAYTVLYAEDDVQTQESMVAVLKRIFKHVYVADDGAMGLSLFETHRPDLVITDIQMPKKNGLDMARAIKELAPQTPIVITTAFNEERYFLGAIESGVDAFLFKPIDRTKLFQTLLKSVSLLAYKAKSKELEALKKVHEINQASEESIQNLANLLPFPALFYKDNELIFVNTPARKTFEHLSLESIQQETLFVSRFNVLKDKKQKVKIPTTSGLHRIYWLYPNALFVGLDLSLVQAYIFIDVTVMEYQKLRLNAHTLPSLKKEYAHTTTTASIHTKTSHISAKDFLQTVTPEALHALEEMKELHDFVLTFAYDYQSKPHDALRAKLVEIYKAYATILKKLTGFEEVGETLEHVSNLLMHTSIHEKKHPQIALCLASLSEELFQCYRALFITKDAANVYAFKDTIMAACYHVNAELTHTQNSLGDDLEIP